MDPLAPLIADGVIEAVISRLKSGKEADIYLVEHGGEVVAAKVYKEREQRNFKNNASYKEGRQVRNSRTQRAMAKGSKFGQAASEDAWKATETEALGKLHAAGCRVPQPVMFYEGVLLMELVIDPDGMPAPRLIDAHIPIELAAPYYLDLRQQVVKMLTCDMIHGDLSPYNVMVAWNGPTIIDFPQVVGASHNTQASFFFERDLGALHRFFAAIDPSLNANAGDAREIWHVYERGELTDDFVPTGRFKDVPLRKEGARKGRGGTGLRAERGARNKAEGAVAEPHGGQSGQPKEPRQPKGGPAPAVNEASAALSRDGGRPRGGKPGGRQQSTRSERQDGQAPQQNGHRDISQDAGPRDGNQPREIIQNEGRRAREGNHRNDGGQPRDGTQSDGRQPRNGNRNDGRQARDGTQNDGRQPRDGNRNDGRQPGDGNQSDGRQPRDGNRNDGRQPRDGNQGDGRQPRDGSRNDGRQPRDGNQSDGRQPRNGNQSDGRQPRDGNQSDGRQPRNGNQNDGRQPRNGNQSDGRQPRDGNQSDGRQPRDGKQSDGRQPRDGKQNDGRQPRDGNQSDGRQPPGGGRPQDGGRQRREGNQNKGRQPRGGGPRRDAGSSGARPPRESTPFDDRQRHSKQNAERQFPDGTPFEPDGNRSDDRHPRDGSPNHGRPPRDANRNDGRQNPPRQDGQNARRDQRGGRQDPLGTAPERTRGQERRSNSGPQISYVARPSGPEVSFASRPAEPRREAAPTEHPPRSGSRK
ncbi:MAG: hypothetical protein M3Y59_02845 [Myxococcota bacterium]|nr:hypothetical protein [Myxococcota bacterium]